MQLVPFEEFIDRSNKANTIDELFTLFLEAVKQHGMDRMIFCLLSDHSHIGLSAGVGHLKNYPTDWMSYYFEQKYDQIDPVISYCYQKQSTFTWAEMQGNMNLTSRQKKCLFGGIESGLNNGICTPIWGPHRLAGLGLASSEKKDSFDGRLDLITAYSTQFYLVFERLHKKIKNIPDHQELLNIYLTSKEKEILLWAYKGKSYNDIADVMKISRHGVDFHFRNIYKKLGTNERIYAVSKAVALGLICP